MENPCRFRRFLPPARSTTVSCRPRCGSSSARATFETEPIPSLSSDGRLAIEPTDDPSVLSIRWFGSRHVLHVPARRPFTDARSAAGAGDRRGAGVARTARSSIPSRCSNAASCSAAPSKIGTSARSWTRPYAGDPAQSRADLIATAIEVAARRGAVELREPGDLVRVCSCSTGKTTRFVRAGVSADQAVSLLAGADRHQELLPARATACDAVPRQPRRRSSSTSSRSRATRRRRR